MTEQSIKTNNEEILQSSSSSLLPYIPCVMGTFSKDDDSNNEPVDDDNKKATTKIIPTLEGIVYDSSMMKHKTSNKSSTGSSGDNDNMLSSSSSIQQQIPSNDNNDKHDTSSTRTTNQQQQCERNSPNDENINVTTTTNNNHSKQQQWFVSSLFSSIIRNSFGSTTATPPTTVATTTNTRRRRRPRSRDDPSHCQHESSSQSQPSSSSSMAPLVVRGDDDNSEDRDNERTKNFVQHDEEEENDYDFSILDSSRRCDNVSASHCVAGHPYASLVCRSYEDTTFLLEDGLGCGTRMFSSSFDMADLARPPPSQPPWQRRHVSEGPSTMKGTAASQNYLTSSITFPVVPSTTNKKTTPNDDGMKANHNNNNNVIGILSTSDTTSTTNALQQEQLQQKQPKPNDRTSIHHHHDDEIISFSSSNSPTTTKNTSIHNHNDITMGNACMVCPPNDDGDNNDDEGDEEDEYYNHHRGNKKQPILPLHQQVTVVPLNDTFDAKTYYSKQKSFGRINSHGTFEETILSPSDSMTSLHVLEKEQQQKQQEKTEPTSSTNKSDGSSSSVVNSSATQQPNFKPSSNTSNSSDNKDFRIVKIPTTTAKATSSPPRSMIRKFVRKMSSLSLPSLAVTAPKPDSSKHRHRHSVVSEAERLKQLKISRVKHLLRAYGCTTAEEHVDKVDELLALCKDKKGWEGLTVLGFGYRMIHPSQHCTCHSDESNKSEDCHLTPFLNMYNDHCRTLAAAAANDTTMSTTPTTEEGDDEDSSSLSSADEDDDNAGNTNNHNADDPTLSSGADIFETIKSIRIASHAALNADDNNHLPTGNTTFPSLSAPSSAGPGSVNGLSSVGLDYLGGTGTVTPGSLTGCSINNSVRSGFSFGTNRTELELKERLDQMVEDLAAHNSATSSTSSSMDPSNSDKNVENQEIVIQNTTCGGTSSTPPIPSSTRAFSSPSKQQQHCFTRLVYLPTSTIITEHNRHDYIADGIMYEEVARLTQEASQECMMAAGNLQWVTICDSAREEPIRALVDMVVDEENDNNVPPTDSSTPTKRQKTLLIVTGKGKVRAGIFSRKHLLTTGMEPSTALPLVYEARQRHLRIVILDPNARGDRFGMQTFEKSCNHLFDKCHISSTNLYVLAHSAAGAQLVRFLNDKKVVTTSSSSENDRQQNDGSNPQKQQQSIGIDAIAFTDSTHNVQWTKHNPTLHQALVDETTSIYLKSAHQYSDTHEYCSIDMAGRDVTDLDDHWKHRFGNIPTKWAGTQLHELTNWTGRHCIWEHFDQKLNNNKTDEKDKNNNIMDDDTTHNM